MKDSTAYAACALPLLLFAAGCALSTQPDTPADPPVVTPAPAPPATPLPVTPAARGATAAPQARRGNPPAATPVGKAPPQATQTRTQPVFALDLAGMKVRLRATKGIGLFTKITLKNQIDDLMDRFRDHYSGKTRANMVDLRRSFDMLMMKVLSLLQDADHALASAIASSREALWVLLADPKTFAALNA